MADNPRLEGLRRRVQEDPSSIAFAQLAEEYRRAGQLQDAVDVCRAGLAIHPAYLSARVTLGRALLDLSQFDAAQQELELVLKSAAENLAAIRGLAEIHHRRGSLAEALAHYRAALALARNDPDLEQTIKDLASKVEPQKPAHAGGLSFEQARRELLVHTPPPAPAPVQPVQPAEPVEAVEAVEPVEPVEIVKIKAQAMRTIAALEQWLQAIAVSNVTRAERRA
jgi:tetratricopeptide (TPR) repeat protein